ncbi:aminotransferase class IV [Flavobacterium sp. NST-5]|uniref:branched-chain-amino-acid transaminase n=1 Tax=Flavobacterium ichthyis TaxID=2698827 RepID=A0ABW9ZCH8_9FLAO|nr:aminotransferase class IV [Flavobacterium ichthyis]NBL64468.1 aminotransferase class IV [Flavobacterium ichthyis]
MVNLNGNISDNHQLNALNRGFLYGDSVFETVRVLDGKVLFLEDHYFRLMASMRIVRMDIPMDFTMDFFENQLLGTAVANNCENAGRARLSVFRNGNGFYLPEDRSVSFVVTAQPLAEKIYSDNKKEYEVEIYKDFTITKHLLSTLKTNNRILNVAGNIFASENGYQNCLLINDSKNIVEALNGNIFMLTGNHLVTPPLSEGCLNGIMRKQVLAIAKKLENIEVLESAISPFDLQKADELFITNVISGLQPITKYRKKDFTAVIASEITKRLNAQIRFA